MTRDRSSFLTQRWRRLARHLEESYSQLGRASGSSTAPRSPSRSAAMQLARECAGEGGGLDLANILPSGWAGYLKFERPDTCWALERLAALPPVDRIVEAARGRVSASADLILAVLDLAKAVAGGDRISANSLAQCALTLTARLAEEGGDCQRVVDEQAVYWLQEAEEELVSEDGSQVVPRLEVAQALVSGGGGDAELSARLAILRAQFFWQEARVEPCLVEIETALLFCDAAENRGLRGSALFLQGVTLATIGRKAKARAALEDCLAFLPGTREEWLIGPADEMLARLDRPESPSGHGWRVPE